MAMERNFSGHKAYEIQLVFIFVIIKIDFIGLIKNWLSSVPFNLTEIKLQVIDGKNMNKKKRKAFFGTFLIRGNFVSLDILFN